MDIIITGTSRGIGKALVEDAVSKGHRVLTVSTKQPPVGSGLIGFMMDTDHEPDAEELKSIFQRNDFKPQVLIHNAGAMVNKAIEDICYDDFEYLFRVNVWNAFRLTQIVLPYLCSGSHVVNIGSMGGFQGSVKFPGLSIYSASKAALSNLGECFAEELKDRGIAFNTLALGAVQTEMLREAFPGYKAHVHPEEMAAFILDFALNAQRFVNGKIVPLSVSTP